MKRAAVILAGGAGTRLRPLSSDDNPKQFLEIFDGQSLLQMTWSRLASLVGREAIYVSTNARYRDKCLNHLPALAPDNVLVEPARRNTAPAIALSCFEIEQRTGEVVIAILPSDHFIADEPGFLATLDRAFDFAERHDVLVTIGIAPTEPHTGFGYLELGEPLAAGAMSVRRFIEKPSLDRATDFVQSGNYLWNGGIFVWRSDVFRREIGRAAPDIAAVTMDNYEQMASISIDYALMEKAPRVATFRGDFGWSDVGSFEALERAGVVVPEEVRRRTTS